MKRRLLTLAGVVVLVGAAAVIAQQRIAVDKQGLDEALEAWVTAFNKHDAKAIAMEYAEDADVMFPSGEKFKGREAIEKGFADTFAKNPNVRTKLSDVSRMPLSSDIVVEDGTWEESGLTEKDAPTKGHYTTILTKRNGKWLIIHERAWASPRKVEMSQ